MCVMCACTALCSCVLYALHKCMHVVLHAYLKLARCGCILWVHCACVCLDMCLHVPIREGMRVWCANICVSTHVHALAFCRCCTRVFPGPEVMLPALAACRVAPQPWPRVPPVGPASPAGSRFPGSRTRRSVLAVGPAQLHGRAAGPSGSPAGDLTGVLCLQVDRTRLLTTAPKVRRAPPCPLCSLGRRARPSGGRLHGQLCAPETTLGPDSGHGAEGPSPEGWLVCRVAGNMAPVLRGLGAAGLH